jgi:hypothetical protein
MEAALSLARIGVILVAGWFIFHVGELAERGRWSGVKAAAVAAEAATDHRWSERFIAAQDGTIARFAALQPIVLRSTNTVREYAQTADGRALCLPAERVRGIAADAAALRAAAEAADNAAVPVDATGHAS